MTEAGYKYLSSQKNVKEIKQEVPFLSRCIDVVFINTLDEIVTIEFKVSKWRHAIEQASNHKLGADKAYICLPKRHITKALSEAVTTAGLGLLIYDPDSENTIQVAIEVAENNNIPAFKKILLETFNKL